VLIFLVIFLLMKYVKFLINVFMNLLENLKITNQLLLII